MVEKSLEANGVALFKRIFEISPESLHMFGFKDEANLYESKALIAHSTQIMHTVGIVVAGAKKLDKVGHV